MTREERAREAYAQAVERLGGPARMSIAADIRADTSTEYYHVTMAAMLAFADAEAAAMRERAANTAATCELFDGERLKNSDPRQTIAAAIWTLPATGEVGR